MPDPSTFPALRDALEVRGALEAYLAKPELSGRKGIRRGPRKHCNLGADHDLKAVELWLQAKKDASSPKTLDAYQREAERLLRWCWLHRQKALSDLLDDDLLAYDKFLRKPPASWINPKKLPRQDPHWRPFRGPLPAATVAYSMRIVHHLMDWLVQRGYLLRNPVDLSTSRVKSVDARASRTRHALTPRTWSLVVESIEAMPRNTDSEKAVYERTRYVMTLLYLMSFRVGDLGANTMSAFRRVMTGEEYQWFWCGARKGTRKSELPAPADVMEAVYRYRTFMGLEPAPQPNEDTGMVLSLDGRHAIKSDSIYRIVIDCFAFALKHANEVAPGRLLPEEIQSLAEATTHWMRHTGITAKIKAGLPLTDVQKLAGHVDVTTTTGYVTTGLSDLHDAASRHRLNWPE